MLVIPNLILAIIYTIGTTFSLQKTHVTVFFDAVLLFPHIPLLHNMKFAIDVEYQKDLFKSLSILST